ncbi:MAG: DEAD/DEAH box helicase [Actinobacteria bacterium]|nr:DEAD/DEAH box helicase [Actinomycetota bacterium]
MRAPAGEVTHGFTLDRFQVEAIAAVDAGSSVLVAAPTGSGKTIVAEHAVRAALASGRKAFYTTPIKALSNQKYADLAAEHGAGRVGLLTGDNAINGEAPIVVMTTEVLRNMVYAASPSLRGLAWVVLDEVHYLQDPYRGPVWEEVIIHAPPEVRLVCLSATVSNAGELADWIREVRGPTEVVVEERRPVELQNLYAAFDKSSRDLVVIPTLVDGRPNSMGERLDGDLVRGALRQGPQGARPRRRFGTPRRLEVVEWLAEEDLLPAICFVFSRAGCDDAARGLLEGGVRLTSAEERRRIRAIAEDRTAALSDADLDVLGYDLWLAGLEHGVAAHHAGMVPPFKEAVEACFVEGLVKVVFATETLALGINMPARSVVIESLTKFSGEHHDMLTPAEYTQLTGRAGRRGMDELGRALVLWSPYVRFDQVAALAMSRRFALTSAFRPTYNMAANLVRRYDEAEAHNLLNRSFAQFQADRSVVSLQSRLDQRRATLTRLEADARCDAGDVEEYRRLLRADDESRRAASSRTAVNDAFAQLRPGDVMWIGARRVAVLSVSWRGRDRARLHAVDDRGRQTSWSVGDLDEPPLRVGSIELPEPYAPNQRAYQQAVARALARSDSGRRRGRRPSRAVPEALAPQHPVAACPDAAAHVRAAGHVERVRREVADLERRVGGAAGTVARRFDAVLGVLRDRDFVRGWALTHRGRLLVRIFHESDLLVAEAVAAGVLDDLDPAALAGVASAFTYEHRSRTPPPPPWFPSPAARRAYDAIDALAARLNADERAARLPETRPPDPTFIALAHAWALGEDLDRVLEDEDLSGGDFVRNVRQLMDLLRQIADAAPRAATRDAARAAAAALFRGVVAASAVVGSDDSDEVIPDDDVPGEPAGAAPAGA